jgi:hypothetical protein
MNNKFVPLAIQNLLEEKTPSENETGTYANGKIGGSNAENSNGYIG